MLISNIKEPILKCSRTDTESSITEKYSKMIVDDYNLTEKALLDRRIIKRVKNSIGLRIMFGHGQNMTLP